MPDLVSRTHGFGSGIGPVPNSAQITEVRHDRRSGHDGAAIGEPALRPDERRGRDGRHGRPASRSAPCTFDAPTRAHADRQPLTAPGRLSACSAPPSALAERRTSRQLPERVGRLTLQLGVPVRGSHGVRLAEQVSGPLGVAGGVALDEHPGPPEVGFGAEEFRTSPCAELGGTRVVALRVVVASEHPGQFTEHQAGVVVRLDGARGELVGERAEPAEQGPGDHGVATRHGDGRVRDHRREPAGRDRVAGRTRRRRTPAAADGRHRVDPCRHGSERGPT